MSQSQASVTINIKDLQKIRDMMAKPVVIQTGIFMEDDRRSDGKSNIDIGYQHETGNPRTALPKRSWLEGPLRYWKKEQIEDTAKSALEEAVQTNSFKSFYKRIADECTHIVKGAFASGGYGHWQELSERTISEKGDSTILRDTDQLMKAVKSKVVKL